MVKLPPPLHCCCLLATAAVATPAICAFSSHSSSVILRPTTIHNTSSIRRSSSSSTTIIFSNISDEQEGTLQQYREQSQQEARLEQRQLRSLFKEDEEDDSNTNFRPSISKLRPDELRQLRREIIGRRRRRQNELDDAERDRQDYGFIITAFVPCLLAFIGWETLSRSISQIINDYGAVGQAVDGNKFASDLLRPTITGVVVPVISIALATLVSTTVNVLRARQVEIRALINKEACDLRLLRRALFGMFGTRQHALRRSRALTLTKRYVDQIERECNAGAIENLQVLELSGGVATNELDELSAMLHGVDGAAVSRLGSVGSADDIISRLNSFRSDRVALLLTDFPDLHWIVSDASCVSS